MDSDSRDKVCEVIRKLSTLNDLFVFYWFSYEYANFQKDSITGLSDIVSDCIGELKAVVKTDA